MVCASLSWTSTAIASTIAVTTSAEEIGGLPLAAVQSAVWHALNDIHGHDALMLSGVPGLQVIPALRDNHITTLLHVDVQWEPEIMPVEADVAIVLHLPEVMVTEYVVDGAGLLPGRSWRGVGAGGVVTEPGPDGDAYVAYPELALKKAMGRALAMVSAPTWGAEPDLISLPVVVAADEEYRTHYGSRWPSVASQRLQRASLILAQAGFRLEATSFEGWTSPDDTLALSALLDVVAGQPLPADAALRIGFTRQADLEHSDGISEQLGYAFLPGENLIVVDRMVTTSHSNEWDEAEEGIAVAHEVLHALGVPHIQHDNLLMSATKSTVVHVMSESSRQLARAAAQTRRSHWDREVALTSLSMAAERWIEDPELQIDYVVENLNAGPGFPTPGALQPDRLSALTNVAVGRYYLSRAQGPDDQAATFREGGLAHSRAALEVHPEFIDIWGLGQMLVSGRNSEPSNDQATLTLDDRLGQCDEDAGLPLSEAYCLD
jgi:hypothetical protein